MAARAKKGSTLKGDLFITGDPAADKLLNTDPLALLLGMLLDQQVPMEWAFKGPFTLQDRLGGHLDANAIAAMDPDEFVAAFTDKPALHRFPGSMGKRAHAVCVAISEDYDGDTSRIWTEATDGADLYKRLRKLPGYGDEKSRIFMAILAKRMGIALDGWEKAATPFSDTTPRSVADIHDPESLAKVREFKKAKKAQGKAKTD